jgi:hypothetical protein
MEDKEPATSDPNTTTSTPSMKELWGVAKGVVDKSELVTVSRTLIVTGALAGVCVVFVSVLLGLGPAHLDTPLWVAVYAFAVALPALGAEFYVSTHRFIVQEGTLSEWAASAIISTARYVAVTLGQLGAFVGIIAVFWHFSPWAGILVIATVLVLTASVGVGMTFRGVRYVREYRQQHPAQPVVQSKSKGIVSRANQRAARALHSIVCIHRASWGRWGR